MKKIIFVCTGNTCRSPMAEAFMIEKALKEKNNKLLISSKGINVVDRTINEKTLKSLSKFGIINYTHIPSQLTLNDIEESDVVLTMTKGQKEYICQGKDFKNVFSIGEYIGANDIPDPFGQDESTYDYVASVLKNACDKIYTKLF